ncbi:imine reductase family protein [Kitasatospora sp. NPDC001664]
MIVSLTVRRAGERPDVQLACLPRSHGGPPSGLARFLAPPAALPLGPTVDRQCGRRRWGQRTERPLARTGGTPMTNVTVLGLGNLGQALAATLLTAGHSVTVWNRSPEKAAKLVEQGAVRAGSAAEAVAAAELVVVALLDYPTVHGVLEPLAEELAGRTVANLTSGTPEQARAFAAWAERSGVRYLDGAVMAVPQTVGTPEAFLFYSGSPEAYREHHELLVLLGEPRHLGEDPGLALLQDVALLSGMYGMFAGHFQAVALGWSAGLSAVEVTAQLVRWLTALLPALPHFAAEMDSRDYTTETSNIAINATGLGNILRATERQGVPAGLLAPLQELFLRQLDAGHAAASLSRAVEELRVGE